MMTPGMEHLDTHMHLSRRSYFRILRSKLHLGAGYCRARRIVAGSVDASDVGTAVVPCQCGPWRLVRYQQVLAGRHA